MRGMTTIIITQCDAVMENGDYFQYPKKDPFEVPEDYKDFDDECRNELFWVKIMKPDLPFDFAKNKKLHIKPICWTNKPANLFRKTKMAVKTIEETQRGLLYQSLLDSVPVRTDFLKDYDLELSKTVVYLRNLEKTPILVDEMKDGFTYFTAEIHAPRKDNLVDADGKN
jgi:hypothetical protein